MNEEKFTGKSGIYQKYRPGYSKKLIDMLYSGMLSESSVIADVGAGTGIFSRELALRGSKVISVEPNDDMRAAAVDMLKEFKNCRVLKGTAENTGLEPASADAVTAAQAFHWFDPQAFRNECRRILKKGGKAALIWNSRDANSPLMLEQAEINYRLCPSFKGYPALIAQTSDVLEGFFKDGIYDFLQFRDDIPMSEEQFMGRSLSSSYAPKENDESYEEYTAETRRLFEAHQRNGRIVFPNILRLYSGEV